MPENVSDSFALARRLERAEASANAAFVESRALIEPDVGATWIDVAGASAMFDGTGSPFTQTFGLGLSDPFGDVEFDRVERFFDERSSPTFHEVCALAPAATVERLAARGYAPVEESVVLVRPVTATDGQAADTLPVRRIEPSEAEMWARLSALGWASEMPELTAFIEGIGRIMARARGAHCFVAELDGRPIAAGALNMSTDVALLAGASTIPNGRRRGAQNALLRARLAFAAHAGVDLAMIVTQPGSASQRNAERQGFAPAYTRTKWMRPIGSAHTAP
jgi:hypothetical protein